MTCSLSLGGCETEAKIYDDRWDDRLDGFDLVLILVSYGFVGFDGFNLVLVNMGLMG